MRPSSEKKRARATRTLLRTTRSPCWRKEGKSRKLRCSKDWELRWTTSMREASRCGSGRLAMSSGGRW